MDIVDDACSKCFNSAILKVKGYAHVVFFGAEREGLARLDMTFGI
jgi:hypothetical protein